MKLLDISAYFISILSTVFSLWIIRPVDVNVIPPGITVDGRDVGGKTPTQLREMLKTLSSAKHNKEIILRYGNEEFSVSQKKMGVKYEYNVVVDEVLSNVNKYRSFWQRILFRKWATKGLVKFFTPIRYNRDAMGDYFLKLKKKLDTLPRQARVDLVKKIVVPGSDGKSLDISNSIAALEKALQRGDKVSELVIDITNPAIATRQLKGLSLDKILGWYETSYESWGRYSDRVHNLRVGGSKLTGTILLPGKEISFNEVVGPRSAKEGYRVAPVIALGEMVDGMGGGMCQIASTLFAAAFFSGIDIINAKPHSQISHYIDLGLDATVVWPSVDLVLRNNYDFPVVIRIDVSDGRVRAEILGRTRPYQKIGFERRVIKENPYQISYRKDPEIFEGELKLDQRGQKGYVIRRRRIFFDEKGHEIKAQTWTLHYPPATMIIRKGTKKITDPKYVAPEIKPFKPRNDPPVFRREMQ
ncbi:MAG: VanW family protein [Deltaproteobacteria bacterium]|nr:VanW family protein [Deltaproteobacteria bacterium]